MKTWLIAMAVAGWCIPAAAQDAKTLYAEGLELKEQRKVKEAAGKFEQANVLQPGYTESLYELGWCYNDLQEYAKAIPVLRQARAGWSAVAKVHFELAYAFQKTGQPDSAIRSYNRCLEINPSYSGVYKQLGYMSYDEADYSAALDHFNKYESLVSSPVTDYFYWYRKGYACNAVKDFPNAIVALEKSAQRKQDYANTWLELGFACSRLNRDDEAIAHYKKAIALDPESHVGYNGIAEVYRDNKKNTDEAMSWYRQTLAINPAERKANFGMGYCLNSQGKYSEAIPYIRQAIKSEPEYVAAFVELGYSLYMTGMNTDALYNFNKAITLNPKNENARYYACLLYIKQKNKSMAQRMVDELKTLYSKYADTLQPQVDAM
jgi:tetratricopeptide (TPR) repeat protein